MEIRMEATGLTPARAVAIHEAAIDLLNQIAEDLGGGVTFAAKDLHWIDDGSGEVVIRVGTADEA